MERKEVDRLINRLNKLSDNPTKNLNKMREIARILVDFYMPNKNTHGNDGM
jgi:hypothetical protein